jgi:ABC-type amino acid transport substrate-binding protein
MTPRGSGVRRIRKDARTIRCLVRGVLFFLLAIVGLGCAPSHEGTLQRIQRTGVLKVGTDATYPPFETVDPATGQLVGFDVDLIRLLAEQLRARAEFIIVPFDGIVPGLKSGKYDLIISAMTITPERAEQVLFTEPYTVAGQSIVMCSDERALRGAADLTGKKIGCQLGTTGEMEAKKIPAAGVVSFDAIGAAFRDLENGNLDAVIADTPTARIFIREHGSLRLAGEPLTREEFGMAVRRYDNDLAGAINQALAALRTNGVLRAVEERWGIVASTSSP